MISGYRFERPIFIQNTFCVEEIVDLDGALRFLDDWPEPKRDIAYDVIQRACVTARHGRFPVEAAAENFRRFVKRAGLSLEVDGSSALHCCGSDPASVDSAGAGPEREIPRQ